MEPISPFAEFENAARRTSGVWALGLEARRRREVSSASLLLSTVKRVMLCDFARAVTSQGSLELSQLVV